TLCRRTPAVPRRRPPVIIEAHAAVLCAARKFVPWTWRRDGRSWLAMLFRTKRQTGRETMSIWKMAIACSLTGGVMAGQIGQASAAPMPTNVATMKAAAGDDVTQVYWRGRGWGWGVGGLAAGAIIGSAIAGGPYGYGYGGGPYYGGYGGYGYAPAYYGYG